MKRISMFILGLIATFLIGCSTASNNDIFPKEKEVEKEVQIQILDSNDIRFYNVTTNSFSYEINHNSFEIDEVDLVYGNNVVKLKDDKGQVNDLISNATYTIRVNYSYYSGDEKKSSSIEASINTASVPNYELDVH